MVNLRGVVWERFEWNGVEEQSKTSRAHLEFINPKEGRVTSGLPASHGSLKCSQRKKTKLIATPNRAPIGLFCICKLVKASETSNLVIWHHQATYSWLFRDSKPFAYSSILERPFSSWVVRSVCRITKVWDCELTLEVTTNLDMQACMHANMPVSVSFGGWGTLGFNNDRILGVKTWITMISKTAWQGFEGRLVTMSPSCIYLFDSQSAHNAESVAGWWWRGGQFVKNCIFLTKVLTAAREWKSLASDMLHARRIAGRESERKAWQLYHLLTVRKWKIFFTKSNPTRPFTSKVRNHS